MKILMPIVRNNDNKESTEYIRNLQEIARKTVLQHVYEALGKISDAQFIVVVRKEDARKYHLDDMVKLLIPDVELVIADGATSGSACSCLLAVDKISDEEPLVIAGGDQLIVLDNEKIVEAFKKDGVDAGVVIFDDIHPRWSYVKLDENGYVIEAAEKRPISRNATSGFFYFKKGKDFIEAAESMIKKGASVNGQYYVCPALNELVLKHKKIGAYRIRKEQYFNFNKQKGIEEYEKYLSGGLENVQF